MLNISIYFWFSDHWGGHRVAIRSVHRWRPCKSLSKVGAVFAWYNGDQWLLQAQNAIWHIMYVWPWVQVHRGGNLEIWGVSPQSTGKEGQFTMRVTDASFCNSSFLYLFNYYESPGNACGMLDSRRVDESRQNQVCNFKLSNTWHVLSPLQ